MVDWKCQMRIYDQSVEDEPDESVLLNIFWPQGDMPDARSGDVVIAFGVKVSLTLVPPHAQQSNNNFRCKTIKPHFHYVPIK